MFDCKGVTGSQPRLREAVSTPKIGDGGTARVTRGFFCRIEKIKISPGLDLNVQIPSNSISSKLEFKINPLL
jgi:hypothetical protein